MSLLCLFTLPSYVSLAFNKDGPRRDRATIKEESEGELGSDNDKQELGDNRDEQVLKDHDSEQGLQAELDCQKGSGMWQNHKHSIAVLITLLPVVEAMPRAANRCESKNSNNNPYKSGEPQYHKGDPFQH